MQEMIALIGAGALLNNLALHHLLGLQTIFQTERRLDVAWLLAKSLCCVIALTTILNAALLRWIITPLNLHAHALMSCAVGALLAIGVLYPMLCACLPAQRAQLPRLLPILMSNAWIAGIATLPAAAGFTLWQSVCWGIGGGLGYAMVILLAATLQERIQMHEVPALFRGMPVQLITLAMMAMAFSGLGGMFS